MVIPDTFDACLQINGITWLLRANNKVCNRLGFAQFGIEAIPDLVPAGSFLRVLDVGCGVGPFCVYFAKKEAIVTAIDIDPVAVAFCRENMLRHGLDSLVEVVEGNFADYEVEGKFDLIISNPPLPSPRDFSRSGKATETYQFNINEWRDNDGYDLLDHIFIRGESLLFPSGKVVVVCGNVVKGWREAVIRKTVLYPFDLGNSISGVIPYSTLGMSKDIALREGVCANYSEYSKGCSVETFAFSLRGKESGVPGTRSSREGL